MSKTKPQEERDKEIERLLKEKEEKDASKEDFDELVKKVSKKKPAKDSGK